MNISEETIAFNYELGLAIAQWGYVEGQLLRIVLECVSIPEQPALAITYHSVVSFVSKLTVCDRLVKHRFGNSDHIKKWAIAKEKTSALSLKRNKLAHGWHKLYSGNSEGRRWAIVPLYENGALLHIDGEKPPSSAICVRDIVAIRLEFHALTTRLCNVYEMLRGHPAPFPESSEQSAGPMTLLQITNQIHAGLGFPQKPSQRKS